MRDPKFYKPLRRGENPDDIRRKVVPVVRRNALPPIVDSQTTQIEKTDGSRVAVETFEPSLFYRSQRPVGDIVEFPFNSGAQPRIRVGIDQIPFRLEVISEDVTDEFWINLDGDENATIPPTANSPARVYKVEPGQRIYFENIQVPTIPLAIQILTANGFPATGALVILFFNALGVAGRFRAYFQPVIGNVRARMDDI